MLIHKLETIGLTLFSTLETQADRQLPNSEPLAANLLPPLSPAVVLYRTLFSTLLE